MPLLDQVVTPNTVSLGDKQYYIIGDIQKRRATQWTPSIRTGNPALADQQFASEVSWDDLTGGAGVLHMDEREFPDRFTHSTMNTLSKKGLTPLITLASVSLPGAALLETGANSIITTIESSVVYAYIITSTVIKRVNIDTGVGYYYNTVTSAWVTTGGTEYALPATSTGKAIYWKSAIWIPLGASGLVKYDTALVTFTTYAPAGSTPQHLFIFDEDLAAVETDGVISSTDDTTPTLATDWITRGQIDTSQTINSVVVHRNRSGEPAPWIATDRGWLVLDWFQNKVYESGIAFNDLNADNAKAAVPWDGDLWFGMRGSVHQVLNGVKIVRGPSDGDGLQNGWQGVVSELHAGYDSFLAMGLDGRGMQQSSIMGYNRKGWHMIQPMGTFVDHYYFFDNFNRTHAGAVGTATFAASGLSGVWTVQSGAATIASPGVVSLTGVSTLDPAVADVSIKVTITSGTSGGIVFRFTDTNNYWLFKKLSSTSYQLIERNATVETVRGTYSVTPLDGDVMALVAVGSTIKCYVNGQLGITYTSATFNQAATKHGLVRSVGSFSPDNFEITKPNYRLLGLGKAPGRQGRPSSLLWTSTVGNNLYSINIPDETDQIIQSYVIKFHGDGELILPWFDAGMSVTQKTFLNVQISLRNFNNGTSNLGNVKVYFQANSDDGTWTQMYNSSGVATSATAEGVTTMYFDTVRLGNLYYRARLLIVVATTAAYKAQIVEFVKIRYIRDLPILYGYDFTLDLAQEAQPDGRTQWEAVDDLEDDVEGRLLVWFGHQSGKTTDDKLVYILSYSGPHGTVTDRTATAKVSVVEVVPA